MGTNARFAGSKHGDVYLLGRLAVSVVLAGSTALSCGADGSDPSSGNTGGSAPLGSGGSSPIGTGGVPPAGSGGMGVFGTGGTLVGTGGNDINSGGAPGAGGSGAGGEGSGGAMGSGGVPIGNPPIPSAGCGKPLGTLSTGTHTITSSNTPREYTIDVPVSYDPDKPYRLIFAWHWINASDEAVVNGQVSNGGPVWAYYGLKNQADTSGDPAIFIAPQSRNGRWDQQDHVLFDDILAHVENELCIDTTRVFSTGFSFGAMQTYSLSTNHQAQLRAVSALAPANFNIYLPANTHEPIAYMSTTGMSDDLCYWENPAAPGQGAKYAALGHAEDNGCDIPATVPTASTGSTSHLCHDFTGCQAGYPVKACTFDGGHIAAHADGGTGDNGATTWIPRVTWEFFTQF